MENNLYPWKHKEASTNRTFGNQFLTGSLNENFVFNVQVLRKWGLDGIDYEKENNNSLKACTWKLLIGKTVAVSTILALRSLCVQFSHVFQN